MNGLVWRVRSNGRLSLLLLLIGVVVVAPTIYGAACMKRDWKVIFPFEK